MSGKNTTPLATLEVGTAPEAPYTDYWTQFAEAKLTAPTSIRKAQDMGSYVTRLAEHVIQEADPFSVALMPDMLTNQPQEPTVSNGVSEWYRSLGSFNALGDARGDLLRGAGLLLHANFVGAADGFRFPTTESDNVYDRFKDIVASNPLEHQKPSRDLLLTAQLVHTAAWAEADPEVQNDLFVTAERIYDFIRRSKKAEWVDRLLAGQYRSDIRFHWLGEEMREAVRYGDQEALDRVQTVATALLRQQAADLHQASTLLGMANKQEASFGGWNGKHWAGFMLESFTMIAVRDLLYVRSKPSLAARFEVRRSLPHEDLPRNLRLQPKQAFDVVMSHRDIHGQIDHTTPMQLKLYRAGGKPRGGSKEDFLDEIEYISVSGLTAKQMVRATDNLMVAYAERDLQRGEGPLTLLQQLCGDAVDQRLVAAS